MAPRILLGAGVILVLAGLALYSIPAALIVCGVFVAAWSALFIDFNPKVKL